MDEKKARKRLSVNFSVVVGSFVFILVLCGILSVVSYSISRNTLYTRYRAQMESIVTTAQSYVDDDDMEQCSTTYVATEKYNETKKFFDNFVTHYSDLHYLYILKTTDETDPAGIRAICSASPEDEPIEEQLFLGDGDEGWYEDDVVQKFREIQAGDKDVFFIEDSEWGRDYTLARPLINKNTGNHYAVLCVDVSVKTINEAITEIVLISLGSIVGIGLIFTALLIVWMYFNVVRPLRLLQKSVSDYANLAHENTNPDELIYTAPKVRGKREINDLASSIEQMSFDMQEHAQRLIEQQKEVETLQSSVEEMSLVAHQDALTGVKNKAAYDRDTIALNARLNKEKVEFGIVMIDINDLKVINDSYGHDSGDIYIVGAARIVSNIFKHSPIYRVGGDEMIILLTGVDYKNRAKLVERARQEFIKTATNQNVMPFNRFSAAVGLAVYNKESDKNVESVFRRADQEMYKNKDEMKKYLNK